MPDRLFHRSGIQQVSAVINTLPDDLVLELGSKLDIDTFLSLRQSNQHIRDILSCRNTGVITQVARNTFPNQKRILTRQPDGQADIVWLHDLRYRQLAAIVVEHFEHSNSLSTEDELGDRVRAKAAASFKVIACLASFAHDIWELRNNGTMVLPVITDWADGLELFLTEPQSYREGLEAFEIAQGWERHIKTLSIEELQGLSYLWTGVLPYLFNPCTYNPYGDGDRWQTIIPYQHFSMVTWTIFTLCCYGPKTCWEAWWMSSTSDVNTSKSEVSSDCVHERWKRTCRALAYVQEAAFRQFENAFGKRLGQITCAIRDRHGKAFASLERCPAFWIFGRIESRLRPKAHWRACPSSSKGKAPSRVTSAVPYLQYLNMRKLGLEEVPKDDNHMVHCGAFGWLRPTAKEEMAAEREYERWGDIVLHDVCEGSFEPSEA